MKILNNFTKDDLKERIEFLIKKFKGTFYIILDDIDTINPTLHFSQTSNHNHIVGILELDNNNIKLINTIDSNIQYLDEIDHFVNDLYIFIKERNRGNLYVRNE